MVNAFNWRQYTDEERAKRGEIRNENETSRKRSIASTKAIEREQADNPHYGTVGMTKKTAELIALKPKTFTIYSPVRKGESK